MPQCRYQQLMKRSFIKTIVVQMTCLNLIIIPSSLPSSHSLPLTLLAASFFSPGPNAHRRVEISLIRKIKFHKIHDLMQFIVPGNVM